MELEDELTKRVRKTRLCLDPLGVKGDEAAGQRIKTCWMNRDEQNGMKAQPEVVDQKVDVKVPSQQV
ncbi:hypothetical protein AOLI_G00142680 [Acnodon oligacanthus]